MLKLTSILMILFCSHLYSQENQENHIKSLFLSLSNTELFSTGYIGKAGNISKGEELLVKIIHDIDHPIDSLLWVSKKGSVSGKLWAMVGLNLLDHDITPLEQELQKLHSNVKFQSGCIRRTVTINKVIKRLNKFGYESLKQRILNPSSRYLSK